MTRILSLLVLLVLQPTVVSGQALTRLASSQVSGTMTTSGDVITFPIDPGVGFGSLGIEARGTWTGTVAIQCIASRAGGTYAALQLAPRATTTPVTSFTANGQWSTSIVGCQAVRATATAAMTGTVTITMVGSFAGGGSGGGGGSSSLVCAGDGTTPCVVTGDGAAGTADTGVVTIQGIASMTPVLTTGIGSAGSAATGVSTIQGIASMTPVQVSQVTAASLNATVVGTLANDGAAAATNRVGTLPAIVETGTLPTLTDGRNASLYVNTGGGLFVTPTTGTFATDQTFGTSTYAEATTTGPLAGAVRTDTPAALANTTNEIAPLSSSALGGLYTASASDPCSRIAKSYHVVNMSTATTVEIANAVASQSWHICSVNLVAAAAQTIAIGIDDTDGCGSISAGLHGGATAATGWSFAANGGIALGNGEATVMKAATADRYLCVITGQATQISGTIAYVSAP